MTPVRSGGESCEVAVTATRMPPTPFSLIPVVLVSLASLCSGLYLPGTNLHTYSQGEAINVKVVDPLTSVETDLPFSRYSLPYCKPPSGINNSAENLGELLMWGDQIDSSPYRFRVNVNETVYLCTTNPLDEHDVKLLKQRRTQVNLILDGLPVMWFTQQNGVGYTTPNGGSDDYIVNHLSFTVMVHEHEGSGTPIMGAGEEGEGVISGADNKQMPAGYEIVEFQVFPRSVKHDPEAMSKHNTYDAVDPINCRKKSQMIREQEKVSFTYEVVFEKSDTRWPSRWDAYSTMEEEGEARVHWLSVMYSYMVIFFLAGIVFVMFSRTVRRELNGEHTRVGAWFDSICVYCRKRYRRRYGWTTS